MKPQRIQLYPTNPTTLPTHPRAPVGFAWKNVEPELLREMQAEALAVFAEMVNSGHTFAAALAAVYMSGMALAIQTHDNAEGR